MAGLRPIIEFMSWSFTLVCLDQIVNNAANVRYMSGGQFKVPIIFRGGNGIAHQLGATHSHRMESVYARIPGLIVVAPSTPAEAKGLLKSTIRCDDPVIFLESEKMLNDTGEVPEGEFTLPLGVANVERAGRGRHGHQLRPAAAARGPPGGRGAGQRPRHRRRADRSPHASPAGRATRSSNRSRRPTAASSSTKTGATAAWAAGILYKHPEAGFDYLDAPIEYVHSDEIPVPFNHLPRRGDDAQRRPDRRGGEGSLLPMKSQCRVESLSRLTISH